MKRFHLLALLPLLASCATTGGSSTPCPPSPIFGKRVVVTVSYEAAPLLNVAESMLRSAGAIPVALQEQRIPYPGEGTASSSAYDIEVRVTVGSDSNVITVDARAVDAKSREVVANGFGRAYYEYGRYGYGLGYRVLSSREEALRYAGRAAIAGLLCGGSSVAASTTPKALSVQFEGGASTPASSAREEWTVPGASISVGRGYVSTPGVRGTTYGYEFSGGKVRGVYRRR